MSVEDGALLTASAVFPHVWKFFWATIADTTFTRKRWYLLSVCVCAVGVTLLGAIPLKKENLLLLQAVALITSTSVTFLGMAVEGLMAHATPHEQRGRVGGWFQAGNLGGSGLGGGLGLWLATHLPSPWMSGAILGVIFISCTSMLIFVPEAPPERRTSKVFTIVAGVGKELWEVIKSRQGILCATLCFLPICTGAATNVLGQAKVAADWKVGEDTVALANGVLTGLVSAFGCLVGGEICARMSPRKFYAFTGILMAGTALSMGLAPFNPTTYVAFLMAYAFFSGFAYASFSGFVLQAIGKGAAATKYNAFASLANAPITYMGLLLAAAYTRWKGQGMLLTEAAASVMGLVILVVVAKALGPNPATTRANATAGTLRVPGT